MLPLMTTTNTHQSSHSWYPYPAAPGSADDEIAATLVLHSLFPSLEVLARCADEQSLEILDNAEARGVIDFLDVEFVYGG